MVSSSVLRRARLGAATLLLTFLAAAAPAAALVPDTWTRWVASPSLIKIRSIDFTTPTTLFGGSDGDGVFATQTGVLGPWSQQNSGLNQQHGDFQINQAYASAGQVYAATSGGLFRSSNPTGGSWAPLGQTPGEPLQLPGAVNTVYAVGSRLIAGVVSSGFYTSDDGGAHWNKASGTPAAESPFYITAAGPVLVAASSSGVYASFDQGSSWQLRSDGLPFGTALRVAVDPSNPAKIYATVSGGVYKTTAANLLSGAVWTDANGSGPIADATHAGQLIKARSLVLAPSAYGPTRYFAGTDSGVFATLDDGQSWGKMSSTSTVNEAGVLAFGSQIVEAIGIGFSPLSIMAGTSAAGIYATPLQPIQTSGANAGAPTPSSSINSGDVITAPHGGFAGTLPFFFTWAWHRCTNANKTGCSSAGSGEQHVVDDTDIGKYLYATVTARNVVNPSAVTQDSTVVGPVAAKAASAPVPISGQGPSLSPTASSPWGVTYTMNKGHWRRGDVAGEITVSAAYRWLRCNSGGTGCVPIAGATSATYTSTPDDINHTIEADVTVTNATYGSGSAFAGLTGLIYGKKPVNTSAPKVVGDPYIGETLSSTAGAWNGIAPTYERRWFRCEADGLGCNPILGETGLTYALKEADRGKRVEIEIQATDDDGIQKRTETVYSTPTDVIGDKPVPPAPAPAGGGTTATPGGGTPTTPTGTASGLPKTLALSVPKKLRVGTTISAPRKVSGFARLRYQWQRNGKAIKHATKRTYKLTRKDRGRKLRCKITLIAANGQKTVRYTKTLTVPRRLKR